VAYRIGTRIRTKVEDADLDEEDNDRIIPIGTLGTIAQKNSDGSLYVINWDNGATTLWFEFELDAEAEVLKEMR
jgi:hypothetical protein